jgi:hypothetical protein
MALSVPSYVKKGVLWLAVRMVVPALTLKGHFLCHAMSMRASLSWYRYLSI